MAKVKVKKKSTLIDMTAMSDVTVLLLTFFMLTSTFVQKEPVQVSTPSSVSEIKIPEINVLQVLIEPSGKMRTSFSRIRSAKRPRPYGASPMSLYSPELTRNPVK